MTKHIVSREFLNAERFDGMDSPRRRDIKQEYAPEGRETYGTMAVYFFDGKPVPRSLDDTSTDRYLTSAIRAQSSYSAEVQNRYTGPLVQVM